MSSFHSGRGEIYCHKRCCICYKTATELRKLSHGRGILSQEILCWNRKIIFPLGEGERALTIARDFTFGMRVKTAFHSMGRIYYPTRFCTLHTHPVYIVKICIFPGWRPIPLSDNVTVSVVLHLSSDSTANYLIVLQTFFVMIVLRVGDGIES